MATVPPWRDPELDAENDLNHPIERALYWREHPGLGGDPADWAEACRRWHEDTLPALIAQGHIIDRGAGFLREGHIARYCYVR